MTNPWKAARTPAQHHGCIETWGEPGRGRGLRDHGPESEGDPVTGELYDDAGVPYVSQVSPWVWVAMLSPVSCFIEGRIYPEPTQ